MAIFVIKLILLYNFVMLRFLTTITPLLYYIWLLYILLLLTTDMLFTCCIILFLHKKIVPY